MEEKKIRQTILEDEPEHQLKRSRGRPKKDALPPARSKNNRPTRKRKSKKNKTPFKQRRFNKGTFPPYNEAKQLARSLSKAQSRKEYYDWHKENNIMYIPYDPRKYYKDDWESWNEWLGTTNYFQKKPPEILRSEEDLILPFFEAARWAHSLNLNLMREWKEYIENGGYIPYGIPKRPDYWYIKYGTWYGWPVFLGKGVKNNAYRMQVHNKFIEHYRRVFLVWDKNRYSNDTFIITYGGSLEHAKLNAQRNIVILASYKCNRFDEKKILTPLIEYYSHPIDERTKNIRQTTKWVDLKWQLDNALVIIEEVYNTEQKQEK